MIFKRIINTGFNDRIVRFVLAITFFIIAFFWVYGVLEFLFYSLGALILITSFTGVCKIYNILGISSCKREKIPSKKSRTYLFVILILVWIFLGSYLSIYFTDKIFLSDFEKFSSPYRQTLVYTGQNDHNNSIDYYGVFKLNFDSFKHKYSNYRPFSIRYDNEFDRDIIQISSVIINSDKTIDSNNLTIANQQLKEIDSVLEEMLTRNGLK
ncbi:MAG: DUF2892 domain-containing protein [Candidatus Pacearchaeota archaeon]|jgi:hypothetical protein